MGNDLKLCQPANQRTRQQSKEYSPQKNNLLDQLDIISLKNPTLDQDQIGSFLGLQKKGDQYQQQVSQWQLGLSDTFYIKNASSPLRKEHATKETTVSEPTEDPQHYDAEITEYRERYPYCNSQCDKTLIQTYIMNKREIIKLLQQGPPKQRIRWSCWQLFMYQYYSPINLNNVSEMQPQEEPSIAISKDIRRTITSHGYFNQDKGCDKLSKILNKIAITFQQLGYCQGMNFIAGFLLMISNGNEKETYEFMVQMLKHPKFMLYYLYCDNMPLLGLLEYICQDQIKLYMAKLYDKIYVQFQIQNAFWSTKMIMTLFLYTFSHCSCARLWDYMISLDIFACVSLMCAFIKINEKTILEMQDDTTLLIWLNSFSETELNEKEVESIVSTAKKYPIPSETVQKYAKLYQTHCQHPLIENLQSYPRINHFLQNNIVIIPGDQEDINK